MAHRLKTTVHRLSTPETDFHSQPEVWPKFQVDRSARTESINQFQAWIKLQKQQP